jgi:pimeloyl-ACP methyl ester carboxylesterase
MSSPAPTGRTLVRQTFVLVPGAGGSAWYWSLLVPELRLRGADAVSVDLPADDDSAGLAVYADAVVAAAGDARDVVLVAQSLGGLIAPLVCDRLQARLLVLLNAMVPRPGETGGDWWTATGQDVPASDDVFVHDVPAEVLATAPPPRDQSGRPFEDPWPLAAWPDVPTVVLAGRDDRFFPADFQRRVAADRLGLPVEEVPGGHLAALSYPAELADRLVALAG